jgi:HSP20 family molecular chaperone IbpA
LAGIRAETPNDDKDKNLTRYEQTFTVPQFLDLDKLTASHRYGMLRLTVPDQGERQAASHPD